MTLAARLRGNTVLNDAVAAIEKGVIVGVGVEKNDTSRYKSRMPGQVWQQLLNHVFSFQQPWGDHFHKGETRDSQ